MYEHGCWWEETDPHTSMVSRENEIRIRQSTRYNNIRRLIALYEYGYRATEQWYNISSDVPVEQNMMTFNHLRNVIDTKVAKLVKNKITPMVMSQGGNYFERNRAKMASRGLDGEFESCRVEEVKEDVAIDMYVAGFGIAKVYSDEKIHIEYVPSEDITVDDAEGRDRRPRCIYQRKFIDRFQLLDKYGVEDATLFGTAAERRSHITNASSDTSIDYGSTSQHNMIKVIESWHLPSGPDAKDGRHVIAIKDCTLFDEPWTRMTFPFAKMCARRKRRGWHGLSDAFDLAGAQYEHEKVTLKLQKAHHMMGGSHIIASSGSNIHARQIDNDQGTFFEFDGGNAPIVFNPEPANPQTYQYRNSIPEEMMRTQGVSPLSVSSQIPAGLHGASGKAMQVYEDFESERNVMDHRALERWIIDLAHLVIYEIKSIVEREGTYKSKSIGKYTMDEIDWKDLIQDIDNFVVRIFPISMLAKTPSAKFAQLTELYNQGLITPDQFKRLFEIPDIEAENDLAISDDEIILKTLDKMVLDGEQAGPEPFDDLQKALALSSKYYNLCRQHDVPEDKLMLIRNYITYCQQMIEQKAQREAAKQAAAQPAPAQPAEAPMMPGGPNG